jgi:hypothetical protein
MWQVKPIMLVGVPRPVSWHDITGGPIGCVFPNRRGSECDRYGTLATYLPPRGGNSRLSEWANGFTYRRKRTKERISSISSCGRRDSSVCTRSDNKVRELATVCLPWQQWRETSIRFDDVGISAFHSCVVVDLWQSLSEWRLLLSECVLVCHCENVGPWMRAMNKHYISC